MGFRINTNTAALAAHASATMNNRALDSSLSKLNSGFRITSAADDASGMAIADSLRSQANALGQAIMNANDAIGVIQTADKAMDEQIKILDTIKTKAIQAAQDTQTTETRRALQADINRLMEQLDNIGNTTSFNGQKLLSGNFSNKEFQIGAYSNETIKASIGPTTTDKIGLTRFETGHNIRANDVLFAGGKEMAENGDAAELSDGKMTLTFKNVDGINDVTLEPVKFASYEKDEEGNPSLKIKAGQGLGALVEAINKASDTTGIRASANVKSVFSHVISQGVTTEGFKINGVTIGKIEVQHKDANGALRAAINRVKDQTGVEASVDSRGRLVLANRDGRGIKVEDGELPRTDGLNAMGEKIAAAAATIAKAPQAFDTATPNDATNAAASLGNGRERVSVGEDGKLKIADALADAVGNRGTLNALVQAFEGEGGFGETIRSNAGNRALNILLDGMGMDMLGGASGGKMAGRLTRGLDDDATGGAEIGDATGGAEIGDTQPRSTGLNRIDLSKFKFAENLDLTAEKLFGADADAVGNAAGIKAAKNLQGFYDELAAGKAQLDANIDKVRDSKERFDGLGASVVAQRVAVMLDRREQIAGMMSAVSELAQKVGAELDTSKTPAPKGVAIATTNASGFEKYEFRKDAASAAKIADVAEPVYGDSKASRVAAERKEAALALLKSDVALAANKPFAASKNEVASLSIDGNVIKADEYLNPLASTSAPVDNQNPSGDKKYTQVANKVTLNDVFGELEKTNLSEMAEKNAYNKLTKYLGEQIGSRGNSGEFKVPSTLEINGDFMFDNHFDFDLTALLGEEVQNQSFGYMAAMQHQTGLNRIYQAVMDGIASLEYSIDQVKTAKYDTLREVYVGDSYNNSNTMKKFAVEVDRLAQMKGYKAAIEDMADAWGAKIDKNYVSKGGHDYVLMPQGLSNAQNEQLSTWSADKANGLEKVDEHLMLDKFFNNGWSEKKLPAPESHSLRAAGRDLEGAVQPRKSALPTEGYKTAGGTPGFGKKPPEDWTQDDIDLSYGVDPTFYSFNNGEKLEENGYVPRWFVKGDEMSDAGVLGNPNWIDAVFGTRDINHLDGSNISNRSEQMNGFIHNLKYYAQQFEKEGETPETRTYLALQAQQAMAAADEIVALAQQQANYDSRYAFKSFDTLRNAAQAAADALVGEHDYTPVGGKENPDLGQNGDAIRHEGYLTGLEFLDGGDAEHKTKLGDAIRMVGLIAKALNAPNAFPGASTAQKNAYNFAVESVGQVDFYAINAENLSSAVTYHEALQGVNVDKIKTAIENIGKAAGEGATPEAKLMDFKMKILNAAFSAGDKKDRERIKLPGGTDAIKAFDGIFTTLENAQKEAADPDSELSKVLTAAGKLGSLFNAIENNGRGNVQMNGLAVSGGTVSGPTYSFALMEIDKSNVDSIDITDMLADAKQGLTALNEIIATKTNNAEPNFVAEATRTALNKVATEATTDWPSNADFIADIKAAQKKGELLSKIEDMMDGDTLKVAGNWADVDVDDLLYGEKDGAKVTPPTYQPRKIPPNRQLEEAVKYGQQARAQIKEIVEKLGLNLDVLGARSGAIGEAPLGIPRDWPGVSVTPVQNTPPKDEFLGGGAAAKPLSKPASTIAQLSEADKKPLGDNLSKAGLDGLKSELDAAISTYAGKKDGELTNGDRKALSKAAQRMQAGLEQMAQAIESNAIYEQRQAIAASTANSWARAAESKAVSAVNEVLEHRADGTQPMSIKQMVEIAKALDKLMSGEQTPHSIRATRTESAATQLEITTARNKLANDFTGKDVLKSAVGNIIKISNSATATNTAETTEAIKTAFGSIDLNSVSGIDDDDLSAAIYGKKGMGTLADLKTSANQVKTDVNGAVGTKLDNAKAVVNVTSKFKVSSDGTISGGDTVGVTEEEFTKAKGAARAFNVNAGVPTSISEVQAEFDAIKEKTQTLRNVRELRADPSKASGAGDFAGGWVDKLKATLAMQKTIGEEIESKTGLTPGQLGAEPGQVGKLVGTAVPLPQEFDSTPAPAWATPRAPTSDAGDELLDLLDEVKDVKGADLSKLLAANFGSDENPVKAAAHADMKVDLSEVLGGENTTATEAQLLDKIRAAKVPELISKDASEHMIKSLAHAIGSNIDGKITPLAGLHLVTNIGGEWQHDELGEAITEAGTIGELIDALGALREQMAGEAHPSLARRNGGEEGEALNAANEDAVVAARKSLAKLDAIAQLDGFIDGALAVKNKLLDIKDEREENGRSLADIIGLNTENSVNFGRLSLVGAGAKDIQLEITDAHGNDMTSAAGFDRDVHEKTVSLRETNAKTERDVAAAQGFNAEDWMDDDLGENANGYPAGVMTFKGAQAMIDIAETAQKALEAIRSDLGSVQNQLVVTVNNISVTQVNVKAAESNIRDVDFAQESATFSKHQILAQSGVYAMSQANAVQQNVMRLLQ